MQLALESQLQNSFFSMGLNVRKFLAGMGMRWEKVGVVPAKVNPELQAEFKKKLEPSLEEALVPARAVFSSSTAL